MKKILPVALMAAIVLSGCGNPKATQVRTQTTLSDGGAQYPMPTAYEVTTCINSAGAAFVFGITNPVGNAEKYLTSAQKALNVGIYGADLAYVSVYNQEQETRNYLQVLHKLTSLLDINTNFNGELVKKVEDNIDNKDTVIDIVTRSFHDTYNFLVNNGQDDISLFVLTGAWVEGMYVTTYLATTSARTEEILNVIVEQKAPLATLLGLLEGTQNEELQSLRAELATLADALALPEGTKFSLDNALAFREQIEKLRNTLVK
jgi:hypothetical protein